MSSPQVTWDNPAHNVTWDEPKRGGAGGSWEPQDNPIVRFGKGALDAVNGVLQAGPFGVSNEAPPVDAQGKAIPPSFSSMKQELVDFVKGFAAQKEVNEGDYAAAAGKILTNLAMMKAAHEAGSQPMAEPKSLDMGTAPGVNIPGLSEKGAKVAARVGGAVVGSTVGSQLGHPWLGLIAGEQLGGAVAPKLTWQGFNIGREVPQGLPDMGPQRAAEVGPKPIPTPQPPPESGAAAEARAYFEQKLAQRKANQPTPATQPAQPAPQPESVSIADQTATAKNLGFKTLAAAKAKFGEEGWQKVIGSEPKLDTPANVQQAVSDAVDKIAPQAPPAVKSEINFHLQKGDIDSAQQVLEKAKGPNSSPPIDFRPSLVTEETKRTAAADALDDKMWKEQMEADYGTEAISPMTFDEWIDKNKIPRNSFASDAETVANEDKWNKGGKEMEGKLKARQSLLDQYHDEVPESTPHYSAEWWKDIRAQFPGGKYPTSRQGRMTYAEATRQFLENNDVETPKLQGAGNRYPVNLVEERKRIQNIGKGQ